MTRTRSIVTGLVVGVAFVLGASVSADEPIDGIGILTDKDLVASTVTIDAQVYRVSSSTQIRDLEGERMELEEVPVASSNELDVMFEYNAVPGGSGAVLSTLRMTKPVH